MISRRLFLQSISATAFMPTSLWAEPQKNDIFISGSKQSGVYNISAFNRQGKKQYDIGLPERSHDIATNKKNNHGAIFARRPDTFVVVFDIFTGHVIHTLKAQKNRHFYGHGYYNADGSILFSTEKNIDTGVGVVGIWDVKDSYKRIGEIPAHGIGPHEMTIIPNSNVAVIAVGGIQTHKRKKTNIDTMQPSLNYIDLHTATLLGKYTLPDDRHKLSIRHLDVADDGTVIYACQDEDKKGDLYSLTGFHKGQDVLNLANTPLDLLESFQRYCGSVQLDKSQKYGAVSSPRGGIVSIWDVKKEAIIDTLSFDDSCGVSATHKAGEFLLTSGNDGCMIYDIVTKQKTFMNTSFTLSKQWDNHATGVYI